MKIHRLLAIGAALTAGMTGCASEASHKASEAANNPNTPSGQHPDEIVSIHRSELDQLRQEAANSNANRGPQAGQAAVNPPELQQPRQLSSIFEKSQSPGTSACQCGCSSLPSEAAGG